MAKYSIKFAKILDTIKKSKGLIFVFSNFIEQGTLPFALTLEQNGFDRMCVEGEDNLLDYNANPLKGGGRRRNICYLCSHEANYEEHYNEKLPNYHVFKRAKYILFFGKQMDIIRITRREALNRFKSRKNMYGEEVKVFIGTKIVSEGLNFERIRQVHIMEPWYNLSRHEQIIGRAIRYNSHDGLKEDEQNVEIYQYATILDKKNKYSNRETIDLKNYRIAEAKDITIKKIARIMKETAVDCVFFRNANIISSNKKIKQITASGEVVNVSIGDKPYSPLCDYQGNCDYKCSWIPNPRMSYPLNTDTYNIKFAVNDIEKVKKYIKQLFRENIIYYLGSIEKKVYEKYNDIDKIFIYMALEQLVNNKNEIVYDKFSRNGYIIYRGDYYIFQPFDIERDDIPLIYRYNPSSIKPEYVDLEDIETNYTENVNNNSVNNINQESFINMIMKKIEVLYRLHYDIINNDKTKLKVYINAVIGLVLDKLAFNEELIFIKYILKEYIYEKNLKKSEKKYFNSSDLSIDNIINYLNKNDMLINYYADINYNKAKINNNVFVGFIIDNKYYIIDSVDKNETIDSIKYDKIEFVLCSKEIISKIMFYRKSYIKSSNDKNKIYSMIYGIISVDKKGNKKFKILDKSQEVNILTKDKIKSKRTIITGRTCTTYDYSTLLNIREKVGMRKIEGKKKIDFLCEDLEIYFRYMNMLKSDNKIWFDRE